MPLAHTSPLDAYHRPGFGMAWRAVLAVALIDAVWMIAAGWSCHWQFLAGIVAIAGSAHVPLLMARYGNDERMRATLGGVALLLVYVNTMFAFSYLVVSTNAPLVDDVLQRADVALGFDWRAFSDEIEGRPWLAALLHTAYVSGVLQMFVFVLVIGKTQRINEFLRLMFAAGTAAILLSGFFPASGAWIHQSNPAPFDPSILSHFELLRDGRMRSVPFGETQGLVSIPSMHAATAVLLVWAARGTFLFAPFVVLNALMLVSTPTFGGHYLVDVIAGVVLAVVVVAADRRLSQRQPRLRDDRTLAPPIATLGGLSASPGR